MGVVVGWRRFWGSVVHQKHMACISESVMGLNTVVVSLYLMLKLVW